jgi:O-methyltransferase domain
MRTSANPDSAANGTPTQHHELLSTATEAPSRPGPAPAARAREIVNATSNQTPPHLPVLDVVLNTFMAQALRVVVQREIPDLLAEQPRTVPELAARTGADVRPLIQVMRALTGFGAFAADGQGRLRLTELGQTLCAGHPSATRDMVLVMTGPTVWRALTRINETVATGRTGIELEFSRSFFDVLRDDPEQGAQFNRMMKSFHGAEPAAVAAAYDFAAITHLVDVGGGIGTMIHTLLSAYPHLKGTVFDQPPVIEQARRQPADPTVQTRCTFAAGNFFESVPSGADAYLLSHIIHDWDSGDCARILATCRAAMTPASRLLIVEMVLPDGDEPHPGKMLDLVMMSVPGGQERTGGQYHALLASAGLRVTSITPTSTPVSVVEAVLA